MTCANSIRLESLVRLLGTLLLLAGTGVVDAQQARQPSLAATEPASDSAAVRGEVIHLRELYEIQKERNHQLEGKIAGLESENENREKEHRTLDGELSTFRTSAIVLGGFAGLLGFFGFSFLRGLVREKAAKEVGRLASEVADGIKIQYANWSRDFLGKSHEQLAEYNRGQLDKFKDEIADNLTQLSSSYQAITQMLHLAELKQYADALDAIGWDGELSSLRGLAPAFRRKAIFCLARSKGENSEYLAWEAASAMLIEDQKADNLALCLRLAVYFRRWEQGLEAFKANEAVLDSGKGHKECEEFLFVIYRRLGHTRPALALARKRQAQTDISVLTNISALYRDVGSFDRAHDLLYPTIRTLQKAKTPAGLPQGWHRLFNTFVAVCLDRGRPADASDAVRLMIAIKFDPMQIYSCLRVAAALEEGSVDREEFIDSVRSSLGSMDQKHDATVMARALLEELDGNIGEAMAIVGNEIENRREFEQDRSKKRLDEYYLRCYLGELYLKAKRLEEAADVLHVATQEGHGGEAKFLLARTYALKQELLEATRWLRSASDEAPRWAVKARDTAELRGLSALAEIIENATRVLEEE